MQAHVYAVISIMKGYMKDPEKSHADSAARRAVKITRATWRIVAKIVLHGAVSIGVGTGGWGPVPAQYFAM